MRTERGDGGWGIGDGDGEPGMMAVKGESAHRIGHGIFSLPERQWTIQSMTVRGSRRARLNILN